MEDQGVRVHQSAQSGSQFEHTVLESLAKFGQLNSFMVRAEGGDSPSLTPAKCCRYRKPAEIGVTGMLTNVWKTTPQHLTWPDKDSAEEPTH